MRTNRKERLQEIVRDLGGKEYEHVDRAIDLYCDAVEAYKNKVPVFSGRLRIELVE